ncbi:MAG: transglutaminase domain-containing protein [Capsulimonadaceae bacterium]|nr:transglutaminase domain-containing protein [Capsulimonadaceae bacterium]
MANALGATAASPSEDNEEPISLPLYLCGLIVTWCGIGAVNSVLSNDVFTSQTLTLVTIGFVFSYLCRSVRIDPRLINGLPLLILGYIGIRMLRHSLDIISFIPIEAQQNDNFIAVLLVWFSVVRSWMLVTDGAVVFTAVTSIAMIGLVGAFNVNTDQVLWFTLYVMSALYMIMHQNHLAQRGWLAKRAADAQSGVFKTHFALCVLIGLLSLLSATLLVVPIRMVGANLSLGQAIRQFFAPSSPSEVAKPTTIDFSDDPSFAIGAGGDGYTSDDTIVMTARPSDKEEHYWRGRTYDHYGRHGWTSTLSDHVRMMPSVVPDASIQHYDLQRYPDVEGVDRTPPARAEHTLSTTFDIMLGRTGTIYAPSGTYAIEFHTAVDQDIFQGEDGFVGYESFQQKLQYDALSDDRTPSVSDLMRVKPTGVPLSIRRLYLDDRGEATLTVPQRVRLADTARSIVDALPRDKRTVYNEADAIRQWIAGRCTYSLNVSPVPQDEDAVSYFLFNSRKGYCDLFASSMTLLCRYAGLPARVATGFAPGARNGKDSFDIRARDKHAWVEVFFPGIGWYTFDPTSTAPQETSASKSSDSFGFARDFYVFLINFMNLNGPIPIVLFVVIVLCLSYVVKIEVVDRLREEAKMRSKQAMLEASGQFDIADEEMILAARHLAQVRYRRMESALRAMGLARRGARSPAEYARSVRRLLPPRYLGDLSAKAEDVIDAVDQLTEEITIAAYAPDTEARTLILSSVDRRSQTALKLIERGARTHQWTAFLGTRTFFGRRLGAHSAR